MQERKVSNLVIVESPTKARTLSKILGKDFLVKSSMGHLIDLPENRVGIYISKGFKPYFCVIPKKRKILEELKKLAYDKKNIYIATDPDREGEAIGFHIKRKLKKRKDKRRFLRVEFHEITESAVKSAFLNPREINLNLVNAQIARRILDRIVGYFLSPLLWRKVKRGLSAGRVQSVALKFIVDREREIQNFKPSEYWEVEAEFGYGNKVYKFKLTKFKGKKIEIKNKEELSKILKDLEEKKFVVKSIKKTLREKKPPAPFNTSSLQQEAFNKLGFTSKKTMLIAQRLYEGIVIKDTPTGLITYMRTDSLQVSQKAKSEAEDFILKNLGPDYLQKEKITHKEKRFAQLAHEAIRPTDVFKTPESIKEYLQEDEYKLYKLIWQRFLASQTAKSKIESTQILITAGDYEFKATFQKIKFKGFLEFWPQEIKEEDPPAFKESQILTPLKIIPLQHFTQPPPRFTDASLVKILEEKGIGRPSTYAVIISTLIQRNYVKRKRGVLFPTELGILVTDILKEHFPDLMNEKFTAIMESKLDRIETGVLEWKRLLEEFYKNFKPQLDKAYQLIKKEVKVINKKCPKCGATLVERWGRFGKFLSCSRFPDCKYSENIKNEAF